eukprot:jgi/Botrbrau1/3792/Bobra.0183s0025.1
MPLNRNDCSLHANLKFVQGRKQEVPVLFQNLISELFLCHEALKFCHEELIVGLLLLCSARCLGLLLFRFHDRGWLWCCDHQVSLQVMRQRSSNCEAHVVSRSTTRMH